MKLRIEKHGCEFWIHGDDQPIGPYTRLSEARESLRGLRRFYSNEWPDVDRRPKASEPAVMLPRVEARPFEAQVQGMLF